ncbi:MAG: flagellar protein FlaG [bacterium]|nr:flagellar protein FlaG [bacterium]
MSTSAGLTDIRLEDIQAQVKRISPEATPPNMEGREKIQPTPDQAAVNAKDSVPEADQKTQRDDLERMVQQINQEYSMRNISLKFSIDEESGSLIIRVFDTANEKIIRQIPPESILAIRRRMSALLGDIFDAEA